MDKVFDVIINYTPDGVGISIVLYQGCPPRAHVAKPITLEFSEVKESDLFKPTLVLNHIHAQFFLQALKEALEPVGQKKEKMIRMEEKVKGLERHLNDLREVLRLNTDTDPKRLIRLKG